MNKTTQAWCFDTTNSCYCYDYRSLDYLWNLVFCFCFAKLFVKFCWPKFFFLFFETLVDLGLKLIIFVCPRVYTHTHTHIYILYFFSNFLGHILGSAIVCLDSLKKKLLVWLIYNKKLTTLLISKLVNGHVLCRWDEMIHNRETRKHVMEWIHMKFGIHALHALANIYESCVHACFCNFFILMKRQGFGFPSGNIKTSVAYNVKMLVTDGI